MVAAACAVLHAGSTPALAQQGGREPWVTTWTTAVVGRPQNPPPPEPPPDGRTPRPPTPFVHIHDQTLRQIVRSSIGGSRVRVVLSNAFGTIPLVVGAAAIARRDSSAIIVSSSLHRLTFNGRPTVEIPSGAVMFSDPIDWVVPALTDLAIDLYLPGDTNIPSPVTMHSAALQTSYISEAGDRTGVTTLPVAATTQSWFVLTRVEVTPAAPASVVVAFGDSITEGARSTPDTNDSWPSHLARRLIEHSLPIGVANAGIGGNRVLTDRQFSQGVNALARFDRDALTITGVTDVIVLEGINDIQGGRDTPTPSAEDIITGHQQLIARAHARGLRVYGATLTPYGGSGTYNPVGEMKRQAINQWIRTGRAYDGVIDFDLVTRDPGQPDRFQAGYDSGDHLHPNDAGYRAMAEAIDLSLFKAQARASSAGPSMAEAVGPDHVDLTWLSVANVYFQLGSQRILADGYVTRVPKSAFFGGGGGLANTRQPYKPDVDGVTRVLTALGGPSSINLLLTGHSHFDHSFDTATWSRLTNARIVGSKTTCLQTMAEQVPADRCTAVYGGEKLSLGPGVTMRVVRLNHSGDTAKNPEQHDAVELDAVPLPDPATGGLRAGVAEDFPNGGGTRGFLFVVDGPEGRFSWFYQNSASAADLHVPIVVGGVNYGAPLENIKAALKAEGLESVDLWIGTGGLPVAQLELPVLKPKAYLPVHWDSFFSPFLAGVSKPFSDPALEAFLTTSGVELLRPSQYLDKWRLDRRGVRPSENGAMKQALGFSASATR